MSASSFPAGTAGLFVARVKGIPPEHLVVAALLTGFCCLAALSLLTRVVPVSNTFVKLLDVGTEANVWTWANVLVLSYAALAHAACGGVRVIGGAPQGRFWLLSAGVMLAFSLDDFVSLHERMEPLGKVLGGGDGATRFAWIIPGVAVCAVFVAALAPLMAKADRVPRLMMIAGTTSLFAGAIGMEAVSGYSLSRWGHDRTYILLMHAEELLEALGATLFLGAGISDLHGQKNMLMRLALRSISRTP